MNHYDIIIIGAGHNGLVAAAYLAKRGKKVLVLERRALVGGSLVTESFGESFAVDSVQAGGTLRPDIIKDLKLPEHGWALSTEKPSFISLLPDADSLILDPDPGKAADSIQKFSSHDAARWPEFCRRMAALAGVLEALYSAPPVDPLDLGLAVRVRRLGRQGMEDLMRVLPMPVAEWLDD